MGLVNDPADKGIGEPQECTNTVWGGHKYALMWQGVGGLKGEKEDVVDGLECWNEVER